MKRRNKTSRRNIGKRAIQLIILTLLLMGMGVMIYWWHLSVLIDERFSSRRWSIPSKVFSDSTLLYPGQRINRSLFHEKLQHLGYRKVSRLPEKKGELYISESSVELYLHDLNMPSHKRQGFPVQIRFQQDQIIAIMRQDQDKPVPILELEPEEIMLFFGAEREQRQLVSIDQVPEHLVQAVISAEDARFYKHHGVDPKGILRAVYTNLRYGSVRQGGSTLTQQLAKNYFLTPERTFRRKFKELLMALTMEVMYNKNEILEIYLNEIYLGQKGSVSINGVGEASYFYFGKPVSMLTLSEAATIAGLIKGPNHYSPYVDAVRCRSRRNKVLHDMHRNGLILEEELNTTLSSPVQTVGFTDYGKKAPYFIDYLSQQLPSLYSDEALSSLGMSIYTTLDTQVQMAAERALEKGLARLEKNYPSLKRSDPEKKIQGAIIVMQPKTGYILAMVGGRDYSISQFNRITQARRQPGSAFKPFVFLTGLKDFTPSSLLSNKPKTYIVDGKVWEPQNTVPVAEHGIRLRSALARSDNLATVDLAIRVGLNRIVNTALTFRFSTPIKPQPSLALGAFEVIPIELARAYSTFAADGVQPYPLSLRAVVDENGKNLERRHMTIERLISHENSYMMNSLLNSVVREGTARSLKWRGITFPVAGKTGTTNNYRDAWFVGYTPDILALVWVGFDNEESILAEGSAAALPIWVDLMKAMQQHISGNWFKMPPGIVTGKVCSQSGQLAVGFGCPEPIEEIFLTGNGPAGYCQLPQHAGPLKRIMRGVTDALD